MSIKSVYTEWKKEAKQGMTWISRWGPSSFEINCLSDWLIQKINQVLATEMAAAKK